MEWRHPSTSHVCLCDWRRQDIGGLRPISSVPDRCTQTETCGRDFLQLACAHDLEGIVGKLASGRYHADGTSTNWCKIKNPAYTQMTARHELFERRTGSRKCRPMLRGP